MSKKSLTVEAIPVILVIAFLAFNVFIGGWSVDVILGWFGRDISTFGDMMIGLFTAEVSVPVAIIGKLFGLFL